MSAKILAVLDVIGASIIVFMASITFIEGNWMYYFFMMGGSSYAIRCAVRSVIEAFP